MKRYVSRMARKARNAIGARRKRGVRRRKLMMNGDDMPTPIWKPGGGNFHVSGTSNLNYGSLTIDPSSSTGMGVRRAGRLAGRKRRARVIGPALKRRRGRQIGGGDMSLSKRTWKPYKGLQIRKIVRNIYKQMYNAIYRFQGVRRMNVVNDGTTMPGAFYLHNSYDTEVGGSYCPLHLIELTDVHQGTVGAAAVSYQMYVTDAGAVSFIAHVGQNPNGTGDSTGVWQGERTNGGFYPSSNPQERYWTTKWIDIRLNLYGCNTQPTIYDVMLVQPTEAWATRDSTDTGFVDARRNFWQGMVKGMTYNPIMPGNNSWRRGCRVIRSWRKIIQPGSPFGSTDVVDKNPFNHVLRIKYYDGKTRDHQYIESSPASDTAALANAWQALDGTGSQLRTQPKPRARLYLVIRALNTTPVATANVTANNTPSYDMILRKKVTCIPT